MHIYITRIERERRMDKNQPSANTPSRILVLQGPLCSDRDLGGSGGGDSRCGSRPLLHQRGMLLICDSLRCAVRRVNGVPLGDRRGCALGLRTGRGNGAFVLAASGPMRRGRERERKRERERERG
jgi:hypothetical protein